MLGVEGVYPARASHPFHLPVAERAAVAWIAGRNALGRCEPFVETGRLYARNWSY
jgi:hypothetical protein